MQGVVLYDMGAVQRDLLLCCAALLLLLLCPDTTRRPFMRSREKMSFYY